MTVTLNIIQNATTPPGLAARQRITTITRIAVSFALNFNDHGPLLVLAAVATRGRWC